MLLGVSLGLALGVLAAVKKGSFWDYLVVALSILLISVPNLVFALLLQQVFAGKLGWFPVIGWPSDHLWTSGWNYTVLPTLAGCFGYIASYARLLKASMLDVMNQDYIRISCQHFFVADRYPLLFIQIFENIVSSCKSN